ncbi:hypothetical protein M407DRAFT_27882 [Tulasnella calospora MUT 4182]|uniref:Uncharacterized protein n=1 Tax=Tulasnella calospora MUT 4182 TaxID=1051891 RepID=A0A0C3KML7_9AGAM|nr:hypothetical protein M407DRAFT_27882 [Tulasnella calospora MUT 4182]
MGISGKKLVVAPKQGSTPSPSPHHQAELKRTLCMYDECSEVDMGNMVDGINTRIQSLARNIAVKWVKEASKAWDGGENKTMVTETHAESLGEVIGVQLLNALDGPSLGRTPFVLK